MEVSKSSADVYCTVCSTLRTSKSTCVVLGIQFTEYYVLNANRGSHICGKCLDKCIETRLQGLMAEVKHLRKQADSERNLWIRRNRELEDITAADFNVWSFDKLKAMFLAIQRRSGEIREEIQKEHNKEGNSDEG